MLLITAGASALAALITSQVWSNGTILTATLTPVFVAVFKEGMRRPTDKVAAALRTTDAPRRRLSRRAGASVRCAPCPPRSRRSRRTACPTPSTRARATGPRSRSATRTASQPSPRRSPESAPPPEEPPPPPAERGGFRFRMTPRAWKIALITGLLGFVIAAAVITLPELLFGKSLGGGTTLTYFPNTSVSRSSDNTKSKTTATDKTDTQRHRHDADGHDADRHHGHGYDADRHHRYRHHRHGYDHDGSERPAPARAAAGRRHRHDRHQHDGDRGLRA